MEELCKKSICTENYDVPHGSTLLIDGQALVMALGNPQSHMSTTFRVFAKVFVKSVFQYGRHFERIYVLFDRYDILSIKEGTRARRKQCKAICRVISTPDVPLPHDWQGFLCDPKNKADLSNLPSQEIIRNAPEETCVITAGGLTEATNILSNKPEFDVQTLRSTHEEADTRLILHCAHTQSHTVVVWCRDTHVLLMLMSHSSTMNKTIFMKAGTSKKPKFIPVNDVINAWDLHPETALALLPFHAITGSDTSSYLAGHNRKTGLVVFLENMKLISNLGQDPLLSTETIDSCEKFICKLYKVSEATTTDAARCVLFKKAC